MSPSILGPNGPTAFDDNMKWDVHSFCSELALWMLDDDAQPASTSLVGILSSFAFDNLLCPFLNAELCSRLRLLVGLSAALFCSNGQSAYAGRRSTELWGLQASVGTKLLQSLDVAVVDILTTNTSLEKLKALFLALLATIIAVGYSKAWNYASDVSVSPFAYAFADSGPVFES